MKDDPKILDDLAGYLATTECSDDTVLASKWVVTPDGDVRYDLTLGTVRKLHAENEELRTQISTLRHVLDTLKPYLVPIWEQVLRQVQAAWEVLKPIIEAVDAAPHHGEGNICKVCDRGITYKEVFNGAGAVIHTEWQHKVEPADGHQAVPPYDGRFAAIVEQTTPSPAPTTLDAYAAQTRVAAAKNAMRQTALDLSEPEASSYRGVHYSHGDVSTCVMCHGLISYYVDDVVNGSGELEVRDTWWAHHEHPADGHEAVPRPPVSVCAYPVGRGAEGTAPCGYHVELRTEHSALVWGHVDRTIDSMHTAKPEGPKWPST